MKETAWGVGVTVIPLYDKIMTLRKEKDKEIQYKARSLRLSDKTWAEFVILKTRDKTWELCISELLKAIKYFKDL